MHYSYIYIDFLKMRIQYWISLYYTFNLKHFHYIHLYIQALHRQSFRKEHTNKWNNCNMTQVNFYSLLFHWDTQITEAHSSSKTSVKTWTTYYLASHYLLKHNSTHVWINWHKSTFFSIRKKWLVLLNQIFTPVYSYQSKG